jgi:prophage maintenance system killer protein
LKRPGLRLAIEINQRVRSGDEWFDDPDDLDRVESALRSIDDFNDPVAAAAAIAFRVTRAQGFAEGKKRTALLLARWTLDNNGLDGRRIIDPDDRELADLLVHAASGRHVEADMLRFLADRA